jgi:penicillin-binding protein 1C
VSLKIQNLKLRTKILLGLGLMILLYLIIKFPRPLFDVPYSIVAYDNQDQLLGARIAADGQWRFPSSTTLPKNYIEALVAYEDQRFYYHLGIDPISIAGAVKNNLMTKKRRRGGSTIAMQIMRMSLKNNERNLFSKIKESVYAVYISLRYKKSTQLKIYASHAPFGGNVVGIEAACWRYFNKSVMNISWSEAAVLVVLPNAPSALTVSKNRDQLFGKRNRLLKKLLDKKIIDEIEYQLAISEPLPNELKKFPNDYPHLIESLKKQNKKEYKFSTTIDPDLQASCKEIADYHQSINQQNNVYNIAILVLDNETGQVLSYIANTNNDVEGKDVDMIQASRSSGSILKPFLATSYLDEGKVSRHSLLKDIPIYIKGYAPENFDRNFRGLVSLEQALQQSLNVPFVLMLKDYNISRFIEKLKNTGIHTLTKTPSHYGLTAVLGGGEVKLWEVTGSYASMARSLINFEKSGSKYALEDWHAPSLLKTSIKKNYTFQANVFDAGSIYECFNAMKNLSRPNEEGIFEEFSSNKQIAWKTGTSFGHKDAWALGINKNYTVGIWVGNANGASRSGITGVKIAAPVLFDVFNTLEKSEWFSPPYDDLRQIVVCKKSGYKAIDACMETDTILAQDKAKNMGLCPYHKQLHLDENGKYQVSAECFPIERHVIKSFFMIPPSEAIFYSQNNADWQASPPFHPRCQQINQEQSKDIDIIYPQNMMKLHLTKDVASDFQKIIFKASSSKNTGKIFWYLDDQYLGSTIEFHTVAHLPKAGKHLLSVMNESGYKKTVYFTVE